MGSSLGISTEPPDGNGPRAWPGSNYQLTNVNYKHTWPGGPSSMTCRLITPEAYSSPELGIGQIIRLWRGAENVWTGVLTQPSAGSEGTGLTATGLASLASRWVTTVIGSSRQLDSLSNTVTRVSGGTFSIVSDHPYEGSRCLSISAAGTGTRTFPTPQDISGYEFLTFQIAYPPSGPHVVTYTLTLTDANNVAWAIAGSAALPGFYRYSLRQHSIATGWPTGFDKARVTKWTLTVDQPAYVDDIRVAPPSTETGYAPLADPNVDAAIERGLPWERMNSAPTVYTGATPLGGPLKDLLDLYATQLNYSWSVDAIGRFSWGQDATAPTYCLHAYNQGGTRTIDGFATDVYAVYNIVRDKQIDDFSSQVSHGLGVGWTIANDHPYEGNSCAASTAASNATRFFDSEVNLQDYDAISFQIAYAPSGPHEVNYTLFLVDVNSMAWEVGSGLAAMPGYFIYSKRTISLQGPPAGFLIDRVVRWELDFDQGVYLDDMRAVPPPGPTNRITAQSDNASARAKYGRWETSVDLTGQGPLSDIEATAVADKGLTSYGYRARWTNAFTATPGSLTTTGGSPVDLATVKAGCVIRVFGADLGAPEVGETGYALDILIGETTYNEDSETLELAPVDIERKDLITLLGRLPKHRGSS